MNAHPTPVKMEEVVMTMVMSTYVLVLMDTQEFTVKQVKMIACYLLSEIAF